MTLIRPTTAQDIALKERLQEAGQKAKLNLSEIIALNKKFGTSLEYVPEGDTIEITEYAGKKLKGISDFDKECFETAFSMEEKLGKIVTTEMRVNDKITSSLEGNIKSAFRKLEKVLKQLNKIT